MQGFVSDNVRVGTLAHAKRELAVIAEKGACRGSSVDFYALTSDEETMNRCKEICDSCPIQERCLSYAMRYERYGFWGGVNERQRLVLAKRRRIRLAEVFMNAVRPPVSVINPDSYPIKHGKPGAGGYRAHRRRGEPPCAACLEQFRIVSNEQNKLRKEKKEQNI
jgi:hypothetical protein